MKLVTATEAKMFAEAEIYKITKLMIDKDLWIG